MSLRELRKERGLTLEGAAMIAGLDTSTLSRAERGMTRLRPENTVRLARALGISARRLAQMLEEVDDDRVA